MWNKGIKNTTFAGDIKYKEENEVFNPDTVARFYTQAKGV